MIKQPCLGCGTLTERTRCPQCQAPRDAAHNNRRAAKKKQTGQYAGNYKQRAAQVRANAYKCHLCGKPFKTTDKIHADHLDPGNPASELKAAHALCNLKRGSKPLEPTKPKNIQPPPEHPPGGSETS